jgi:hypothetical protein
MADAKKPASNKKAITQNKVNIQNKGITQNKPVVRKKSGTQNQEQTPKKSVAQQNLLSKKKPMPQNKSSPQKKTTQKLLGKQQKPDAKQVSSEEHTKYLSSQANNAGLRFEIEVANRFREAGWNPEMQKKILGYEFDLYEERKDSWQSKYLVVECKNKKMVNADDIVHFLYKVTMVNDNIPKSFSTPTLLAYLCYSGELDMEAATIAQKHVPPINFLKIDI